MIQPGQTYTSCHPLDAGLRVRIPDDADMYGDRTEIETVAADGSLSRRRPILKSALHDSPYTKTGQPRRTGYARDTEETP